MNRRWALPFVGLLLMSIFVGAPGACGRDVSLGAGPPGPPPNACVAMGGSCLQAGRSCPVPTDPALDNACGDPGVLRCCPPAPDGSPSNGFGGIGGVPPCTQPDASMSCDAHADSDARSLTSDVIDR